MKTIAKLFFIALILLLISCNNALNDAGKSGEAGDNGPSVITDNFQGAKVVASISNLPGCTIDEQGQLFYIQDLAEFQYCDGSEYQVIVLDGTVGANGTVYYFNVIVRDSAGKGKVPQK